MKRKVCEEVFKKTGFWIRMTEAEKEHLRKIANCKGVSMSEVMIRAFMDIPIPDELDYKERYKAVYELAKEINYIGKNINQLTMALRQIAADKKIEEGEFISIAKALDEYNRYKNNIVFLLNDKLFY